MKTKLFTLFSFLVFNITFCQKIVIDPTFKTTETNIKTTEFDKEYLINYSYDKKLIDTLEVGFSKRGLGGTGVKIFISDTINIKAFIWADFRKYDGEFEALYDPKYFSLTINQLELKKGDTLMGKIQLRSKPILYRPNKPELTFVGDFFHIIEN
jgi:hypothetical protein